MRWKLFLIKASGKDILIGSTCKFIQDNVGVVIDSIAKSKLVL